MRVSRIYMPKEIGSCTEKPFAFLVELCDDVRMTNTGFAHGTATHQIDGVEYRPARLSDTQFETWGISMRTPGRAWSAPDGPYFSSHTGAYNFLADWQRAVRSGI